ncbi:PE domain-containing protein, partial [Mycobacterium sp. THU-M116]
MQRQSCFPRGARPRSEPGPRPEQRSRGRNRAVAAKPTVSEGRGLVMSFALLFIDFSSPVPGQPLLSDALSCTVFEPELVAMSASQAADIGSSLRCAYSAAAASTTSVASAAHDEVSGAV